MNIYRITHIFREAYCVAHWLAKFERVNHYNEFWYDVFPWDLEVLISSNKKGDGHIRFLAE